MVKTVAFDQFVFDERGLSRADGASVMRGVGADGSLIAVGAMPWPEMPVDWAALQSRRSEDLLGLEGDEMEPVGHRTFDERFAVDADDVSRFRKVFRTSLRDWLVAFDEDHGPLVVLFDGPDAEAEAELPPRRRKTDEPAPDPVPTAVPTIFVARRVDDNDAAVQTLDLTAELAEHVRDAAKV